MTTRELRVPGKTSGDDSHIRPVTFVNPSAAKPRIRVTRWYNQSMRLKVEDMTDQASSTASFTTSSQLDVWLADVERVCVVCGGSMVGKRSDALHCSPPCRAEAGRLRAILKGAPGQRYRSVEERLEARQRRTQRV
jgi:hypothetical protein